MLIELDSVDHLTADAVGEPGDRVFYLQGRKGDRLVTLLVEKQQVQLLAASIVEILARVGKETGQGPAEDSMRLEEPVVPEWRAGRLSIGYREDRDLLMLEAEEVIPEQKGDEEEASEGTEAQAEQADELGELEWELGESDGPSGEEFSEGLEATPDDEGGEAGEPEKVRFWATREQMLSLARHGALVCSAGRPRCQLCGNPIDPEGHQCPALNGHRDLGEV